MKRFFSITAAVALAALVGNDSWSHGGQAGGGSAAGAAGTGGTVGNQGTVGTPGTAGAAVNQPGAAGTVGTTGSTNTGTGANAQFNSNFNGINQTPFFADPSVRSQLQLNNRQFNQLNTAYLRAFQRYNRGLNSPVLRPQPRVAVGNPGTAPNTTTTGPGVVNPDAAAAAARRNAAAVTIAEQQRLARLQQLQDQFRTDFNPVLDVAFTDPTLRQRYNQLNWQFQGIGAFSDPMVQQQLSLTAQQRQQLAALNAEWRRELMQLRRDTRNNTTQAQFNNLRTQFNTRLNTLLTPVQQQQWTQLVGQPFDFPISVYFPPNRTTIQKQLGIQGTGNQTTVPRSATQSSQPPTVR